MRLPFLTIARHSYRLRWGNGRGCAPGNGNQRLIVTAGERSNVELRIALKDHRCGGGKWEEEVDQSQLLVRFGHLLIKGGSDDRN